MFALANVLPNLRNYPTWFAEMQTPLPLVGLGALLVPRVAPLAGGDRSVVPGAGRRVWRARVRAVLLLFRVRRVVVHAISAAVLAGDHDRLRASSGQSRAHRPGGPPCWPPLSSLGLAVRGVSKAIEVHTFGMSQGEHRYVAVARLVREITPANSVVLAMQHSGTVRLLCGPDDAQPSHAFRSASRSCRDVSSRNTARTRTSCSRTGRVRRFIEKFAGAKATSRSSTRAPVLTYQSSGTTNLYDSGARPRSPTTFEVRDDAGHRRSLRAARRPSEARPEVSAPSAPAGPVASAIGVAAGDGRVRRR